MDELWREMRRRWPDVTRDQARRGTAIATEVLRGGIADSTAHAKAVASILQRAQAYFEAAFHAQVGSAIKAMGEDDFRAIADGTGIRLDDIGTEVSAVQCGDPLP